MNNILLISISISMNILKYIIPILFLVSCRSQPVTIPVETSRTHYISSHIRDSVYMHDSVFIHQRNDTVFSNRYKYMFIDRIVQDTIFKTDSIPVIVPIPGKTVTVYQMKWYEMVFFYIGLITLFIISVFGVFKYLKK